MLVVAVHPKVLIVSVTIATMQTVVQVVVEVLVREAAVGSVVLEVIISN
jgi:hypothetical protein